MQCKKFRLFSILLYLGAIECQSTELYQPPIDINKDTLFGDFIDFYLDPQWINAQIKNNAFSRFGRLASDGDIVLDHLNNFILFNEFSATNSTPRNIRGNNITLMNNESPTLFYNNVTMTPSGGSAILANTCRITQNNFPCWFINNTIGGLKHTSSNAGAVTAQTVIIEDNPGLILFKNNQSQGIGAAICAKYLFIRNSGPIVFENNYASWGGAIACDLNAAIVHIFAERGNIAFNNNSYREGQRNAIHCQSNFDLHIGASKNYSVYFYDPVEAEHPTTKPCIFNPKPYHLGTVLFSGVAIPKDNTFFPSLCSKFRNSVQIAHGVVAVEDRAYLFIHNLTQGEGVLRLGNQGVVATIEQLNTASVQTPNHLQISRLALNLPSLLKEDASPPKIWIYPEQQSGGGFSETQNATITISGDLLLYDDENQSPYDSADLSEPKTNIPLLYLCDVTPSPNTVTPKIDASQLNINAINQKQHYGYQGFWEPFWKSFQTTSNPTSAETTNTQHRVLFAHWKPSGYIPNPRNISHFAANSLWTTTYNILPHLQYLQSAPFGSFVIQTQGKATRMVHKQQSKNNIPGFTVNTKGYWTSITSVSLSNHQLSFQFGQNFTQTKEKDSSNRIASKEYISSIQFQSSWYSDLIETSAKAAYAYGAHRIHNIYTTDLPAYSFGDFYTTTLGSSLSGNMPILFPQLGTLFNPFIEFKSVYASMSAFRERGYYNKVLRSFLTETPLIDISSSLGVTFQPLIFPRHIQWSAGLAYQPTIYRQTPKLETVLLSSNGSWIVQGSSPAKHAMLTQFNFVFSLTKYFCAETQYQGMFSSSTISHFVSAGCSLHF